jgi:hypothetical protein
MKPLVAMLLLATAGIGLSSEFTTASATKMDGKCCASSDGGRSYRYRMVVSRTAISRTCSAHAASCIRDSGTDADRFRMYTAQGAQCMRSGDHVGPYSGTRYAGMQKK